MNLRTTIIFACATIGVAAHADEYNGTYQGHNNYWNASVSLSLQNGNATIVTKKQGRTQRDNGSYSRNVLSFGGAEYAMQLERNGLWLTQRGVNKNRAFYNRVGNNNDDWAFNGKGSNAQLAGTYSGYNPMWRQKWLLDIDGDGKAHAQQRSENGDVQDLYGSWNRERGVLDFQVQRYKVNRRGNTLYLQGESRSNDTFTLTRGTGKWDNRNSSSPSRDTNPPDWLVGTFRGFARYSGSDVVLTVRNGGNSVLEMTRNRNVNRYEGAYRNGRIVLENGGQWIVRRTNGGFTITDARDSSHSVSLSERDTIYDRPPMEIVGTFNGRHWDGYNVTLTIREDGNATITTSNRSRVSGGYRNGILRLGSREYQVSAKSNGVRIWEVNTKDYADLSRLGR